MHEAKDSRLQKKNELTLTSMQLNHLCNSASNQCRTSPIYFFKRQFYFFPHVTVLKSENEGSVTNTKTFIIYSPWVHKIGSNCLCSISCVAILLCLKTQVCFCCSKGSVSGLPRTETCFSWMKVGCILSEGLICFGYFSATFSSKQQY